MSWVRSTVLRRISAVVAVTLLVALFPPISPQATAAGKQTYYRTFGYPEGQHGLHVFRTACDGGQLASDQWPFQIVGGEKPPWGPHGIGWVPQETGGAYGVQATFARPTTVDILQIDVLAPAGQAQGFARVDYDPGDGGQWIGLSAEPIITQSGWHTIDASEWLYNWFHYSNGQLVETVSGVGLRSFTSSHGGDGAGAGITMYFGCDGNRFAVDGFAVGSSANGWNVYDFDGYRSRVGLSATRSRSTCQTSPARWPNKISFRGRHNPGGKWQGWQYVGKRNGHWRVVERGTAANRFAFSARVDENSWFDAAHPHTADTEYSDSPDLYVPAFPSIRFRAAAKNVLRGKPLVFTGSIRPARRLSYTVLRSVPVRGRWGAFQSLGTRKTDGRGHFRFTVRSRTPGWARIDILTKSEHDLTSTITRQSVTYQVLKPKKPPKPPPDQPTNNVPEDPGGGYVPPAPEPDGHDGHVLRPKGYGNCKWYPVGRPPGRIQARETGLDIAAELRNPAGGEPSNPWQRYAKAPGRAEGPLVNPPPDGPPAVPAPPS
jgi:hypothetical protein